MQIFNEDGMPHINEEPRTNFKNISNAMIAVFQILTTEGWVQLMHKYLRIKGKLFAIYFLIWVMFGVWCLLNMFLAIVLQNFEKDQKRRLEKKLLKSREAQNKE